MNIRFIKSSEKRDILEELEDIYGIKELNYLLIETGKEKIRAYSGSLSKDEIMELSKLVNIEIIGMYLINKKDSLPRISFDASSLLRNQIVKNVVIINKDQYEKWIRGYDLEISCSPGISILKFDNEVVGIGKSNNIKIFNYVPKERKIKTPIGLV
jgi:NOL1/NOP2/fmu family ribosome biogenesis protein